MAVAYRAGAELRDMEFMQFHPTVLYIAGSSRNLISEAMRGEGALLRDRNGDRFMPEYDAAGRAGPARRGHPGDRPQMEKTQHPNVYLDLSHLDPDARAIPLSPASPRCAPSSASTSRATRSRSGPAPTT